MCVFNDGVESDTVSLHYGDLVSNVIKRFFFFFTDEGVKYSLVFVPGNPFQPNSMPASKPSYTT